MPRMSGCEFRALQRKDRELARIPVVIISGVKDLVEARELEACACLAKPVDLDHLVEVVRVYVAPGSRVS